MEFFNVLFRNRTTTVVRAETEEKAADKVEEKYNTKAFKVTQKEGQSEENSKS